MGHDPTEHVQEHITHEAAHGGHGGQPGWITAAALTAAFLAALAAISGALATKHLTESTQKRIDSSKETIKASDAWNYYQAKSNKSSDLDTRGVFYSLAEKFMPLLPEDVAKQKVNDLKKRAEYTTKVEEETDPENPQGMRAIQLKAQKFEAEAKALEAVSEQHLITHETFEMSATMFHIAIAVVAISVVAKRKEFWWMSMVGGVVGLYFFGTAIAHAPVHEGEHVTEQHAPATPGGEHAAPAAQHAPPANPSLEVALIERRAKEEARGAAAEHAATGASH